MMEETKHKRLMGLYKLTGGGHRLLSESDFDEYSELRKQEYLERKGELETQGNTEVKPVKDDSGDIIGWTWLDGE